MDELILFFTAVIFISLHSVIILIVDLLLLFIAVKSIFGNVKIFIKAIVGHIFSDFDDAAIFKKWEKENGIVHKINLLYASFFVILGISLIAYNYFS